MTRSPGKRLRSPPNHPSERGRWESRARLEEGVEVFGLSSTRGCPRAKAGRPRERRYLKFWLSEAVGWASLPEAAAGLRAWWTVNLRRKTAGQSTGQSGPKGKAMCPIKTRQPAYKKSSSFMWVYVGERGQRKGEQRGGGALCVPER